MLHFPFMCRLCLLPSQTNPTINIFESEDAAKKILELTNVKVMIDDGFPQEVCVICHQQLELSFTFRRQVIRANSMLEEHVARQGSRCSSPNVPLITGDPLSEEGITKTEIASADDLTNVVEEDARECKEKAAIENEAQCSKNNGEDTSVETLLDPFDGGETMADEKISEETDNNGHDKNGPLDCNILIKEEAIDFVIAQPWPENNCSPNDSTAEVDVKPCLKSITHDETNMPQYKNGIITNIKVEDTVIEHFSECSSDDETKDDDILDLNLECTEVVECSCDLCEDNNKAQKESSVDEGESFPCSHCSKSFPSRNGLYAHQRQHPQPQKSRSKRKKSRQSANEQRKNQLNQCSNKIPNEQVDRKHSEVVIRSESSLLHIKKDEVETKQNDYLIQKSEPSYDGTVSQESQLQIKKNVQQDQESESHDTTQLQHEQQSTNDTGGGTRRSSRTIKAPVRHVVPHYSCSKCERMYNDQAALENHEKTHSRVSFKCNHCGKKFYEKELLERHIQLAHIGQTRTRNRGHQCDICNMYFDTRSTLFSHMKSHKRTVHLCEVCGKTVSLAAYPAHKRIHINANSQQVFNCDLCEKKFNNKMSLRTHKNSYHGTLKFTCEVCGKQFTTMALMKHHQNIHSGKRDHVCQVCGRAFSLKVTLKSHTRIHTGEMPYGCETCGRHFTWKTTYRNHIVTCKGNTVNSSNNASTLNENLKPKVSIPLPNIQQTMLSLPQELPIDYSEEQKYDVPIDYSDESKYKNLAPMDTKYFPAIVNLNDEIKYSTQHLIT